MPLPFTLLVNLYCSTRQTSISHFAATIGKHACWSLSMLFSQGRRTHLPTSEHWTWAGKVLSPHPPLPCGKSHYPSVFSFVENGCPLTLKYSLWLCFLWMLQVTRNGFKSLKWVKPCSKTFMTCHTVGLSSEGNVMTVKSRHWGRWTRDLQQHLHSCE